MAAGSAMRPDANHAARQLSRSRLDDAHAALTQNFKIGFGGRMLPHVHIHGRGHEDRRARRQIHCGQKVVCDAMRKLGENIGGRRSHDERLSPLRLADVLDGGIVSAFRRTGFIPEAGDDFVSGERGKGERLHKPGGRFGHHHMHFERLALQFTDEFRGFVSCDPARNADSYPHGSIVIQGRVNSD